MSAMSDLNRYHMFAAAMSGIAYDKYRAQMESTLHIPVNASDQYIYTNSSFADFLLLLLKRCSI